MHKFRKLKFAAILVMIFAIFASLLPAPALAAPEDEDDNGATFSEKILLNTFRLCYSPNVMPQGVADGGTDQYSYMDIHTIFPETDETQLVYEGQPVYDVMRDVISGADSYGEVKKGIKELGLIGFRSSDYQSQCETLFRMFYPKKTPVVDVTGETHVDPGTGQQYTISVRNGASSEEIDSLLQQLGYEENADKDSRRPVCAEMSYKPGSDTAFYAYKVLGYVCWDDASIFDSSNIRARPFTPGNYTIINKAPDIGKIRMDNNDGVISIDGLGSYSEGLEPIKFDFKYDASDTQNPVKYNNCENKKPQYDKDAVIPSPETTCFDGAYDSYGEGSDSVKNKNYIMTRIINDRATVNEVYDGSKFFYIEDWGKAFTTARGNFNSNYANTENVFLTFTWQEIYDFYLHYLTSFYGAVIDSNDCVQEASSDRVYTTSGWCKFLTAPNDKPDYLVTVFSHDTGSAGANVVLNVQTDLKGLLEKMYIIASREPIEGAMFNAQGQLIDPMPLLSNRRVSVLEDRCYINGESLGWVLCPIIEFAHDAMESMYRDIIQGYLTIDSVLLTTGNSSGMNQSGTYQAWNVFVGFANILMIVFLLFIIFSQVTGVGIDNYGIKKALPKIIIAAVLINLSFIICQLLADLSNIIGSSVEGFLTDIGDHLTRQTSLSGSYASGDAFRGILDFLLVAGGVMAAVGTVSTALTSGPLGLLIPLLIGLLVALAAVLFFFVLLGIRKAAIVMLVAVSPIAFACYMLPNLKRQVFDRWFDLLKAMLLVYPLCGFVIGGCNLASAILMSTGMEENFIFYFINMLLMVVPFFLMPTLIKKSMGALASLTTVASRAVRGRISKGGARAQDWNKSRPINQQRLNIRNDNRRKRWERRTTRRYQNGTGNGLARLPLVGGAIKKRRDDMYGAAIQSAMKTQDEEAMRRALVSNGESVLEGSGIRAGLDAQKKVGEIGNYAKEEFATGMGFLNQQEVADRMARTQRYAGKTAQKAYQNKMDAIRDKDEKDDANYANKLSLTAAMQNNLAKAAAKREADMLALLSAGKLVINGKRVDPNNASVLSIAYSDTLKELDKAEPGSEEYRRRIAQAGAIQSVMMKSGTGRRSLHKTYENLIKNSGGDISDNLKVAAQNLASSQEDALESNGMYATVDMLNDIANGDPTAIGKVMDGQYFADNIGKLSPANLKNLDDDTLRDYVQYIDELRSSPWYGAAEEYGNRLAAVEKFENEVVANYFSDQNARNQKQEISLVLDRYNPKKTE